MCESATFCRDQIAPKLRDRDGEEYGTKVFVSCEEIVVHRCGKLVGIVELQTSEAIEREVSSGEVTEVVVYELVYVWPFLLSSAGFEKTGGKWDVKRMLEELETTDMNTGEIGGGAKGDGERVELSEVWESD